jgi:branched-chain amino acid transport system substrate-binding protein
MSLTRSALLARMSSAAAAGALFGSPARARAAGTLKIGVVASLTGPAAGFGRDYVDGFRAYVTTWNARSGPGGRNVEMEILDDGTSAVEAVSEFRRLSGEPDTSIVWLAVASSSALAIKPLSTEARVPIISSGAVDSLGVPAEPFFFKIAPSTNDFMIALLTYAKQKRITRIASINASDAYGQAEIGYLNDAVSRYGVTIVGRETFNVTDTDFNAQLTRLRSTPADLIYSGAVGAPAILIYKQYKQLALKPPLAVSQGAINVAFFNALGGAANADGILSPIQLGALAGAAGGQEAALYQQCSKAVGHPATVFDSFGWDHGIMTEYALAHSDGTRDGIRAALNRIHNLPGVNGPISYSDANHTGQDYRGIRMSKLVNGTFVVAP